jgi:PAS domain S-box-containing protein
MIKKKTYLSILFGLLISLGLYLTTLYSYLLFHSLAEMFSIIVACGIFMLAWNSRRFTDDDYLLFLGIAYLFIGGLDLIHTLAYKGMGVFQEYGANLPTQLWIAARYVESLSLLIVPFLLGRKLRTHLIFFAYGLVLSLLLGSIFFWHVFPDCFIEGIGLTSFKISSEYIISLILFAAIAMLFKKRLAFDGGVLRLLIASIVVTIGSELAFTLYVDVYGLSNLVGHYLKLISFYLIYKAVIETGLTNPFALLFRNLKQSEKSLQKAYGELEQRVKERTAELAKANDEINRMMTSISDYLWSADVDEEGHATYRFFSSAVEKITGRPPEFYLSGIECWLSTIHPDDREMIAQNVSKFISLPSGEFAQEYRVVKPDGRVRWLRSKITITQRNGGGLRLDGVVGDITDRKRAEEALRSSEERFRAFMNHYPAVIYIKDEEGRHVFTNDAGLKITNTRLEDFIGTTSRDLFPPDIAKELEDRDEFVLKKGVPTDLEIQNEMPDGQFHWIKDIKFPIHLGEQTLLGGIAVDITDLKRSEEALKTSEQKYRTLTENLNVGVFRNTAESKGKFIEVNPAFVRMYGYDSRDELLSMNVSDLYEDPTARKEYNEKILKQTSVMDEQNTYRRKDGTTFTGSVSAVAVKDDTGQVLYYDGIVEDITERKETERALQESQNDLRTLAGKLISTQEAERRRLAREMHDDISQRLAILAIDMGKLEQLCEESATPIVEALQDMRKRLVDLSSDIHAISRQLHPSILDDLGLADAVQAECEGFTRREGIPVKYETEAVPSNLPKDIALSLFRMVQEGLRNVAKHAQSQNANVLLFSKDDFVHLNISDDGVGFDYSEARKKPGLGLASMEERVRLIQGDISIKSEPGKGTVIEVRAPLTTS